MTTAWRRIAAPLLLAALTGVGACSSVPVPPPARGNAGDAQLLIVAIDENRKNPGDRALAFFSRNILGRTQPTAQPNTSTTMLNIGLEGILPESIRHRISRTRVLTMRMP